MKFYLWPHNKKPAIIANFRQRDILKLAIWAVAVWLFVITLQALWWAWVIALVFYFIKKR